MRQLIKKFFIIFSVCLVFSGCAGMKMKEGDKLASAGAWDEAVVKYKEALGKDPSNIQYKVKYRRARQEAAQVHSNKGKEHFDKSEYEAAINEFKAALMLDSTLKKAEDSIRKTQKIIDSLYYYGKGMEFLDQGNKGGAAKAFKKAVTLNPDNVYVKSELEKLKKEKAVVMDGYELDLKSISPITLEFKDAGIKSVFNVLSKLSGINFVFDSDVKDNRASIYLRDGTFAEALELLLMTNNFSKKVLSENTIIIFPANPQKFKQYKDMLVKVFYLNNIEAKKAVNLIRTMTKARDIYVHDELNALVVRAEPDVIELTQKILEATDLADAEVELKVDIMEVNKTKAFNLGIDLPDALTLNVGQTTVPVGQPGAGITGLSLKDLSRGFSTGNVLVSIPSGILNLKVEDLDAQILANPRIRVKNREKAKIHIGDRVPIISATTTSTGVITESVTYQDVGLKLSVEPIIRPSDEIDLKISLEVSSLGTATTTTAGTLVYQIGTRNADTNLRLYDGETQIIGGLISDEERNSVAKVPGLGEIPVLGRLFSNTKKSGTKTDLLLSITPYIVRRVEVPEESSTRIWSGREENPSLQIPLGFMPEEFTAEDRGFYPAPPPPPIPGMPLQGGPEGEVLPLAEEDLLPESEQGEGVDKPLPTMEEDLRPSP